MSYTWISILNALVAFLIKVIPFVCIFQWAHSEPIVSPIVSPTVKTHLTEMSQRVAAPRGKSVERTLSIINSLQDILLNPNSSPTDKNAIFDFLQTIVLNNSVEMTIQRECANLLSRSIAESPIGLMRVQRFVLASLAQLDPANDQLINNHMLDNLIQIFKQLPYIKVIEPLRLQAYLYFELRSTNLSGLTARRSLVAYPYINSISELGQYNLIRSLGSLLQNLDTVPNLFERQLLEADALELLNKIKPKSPAIRSFKSKVIEKFQLNFRCESLFVS